MEDGTPACCRFKVRIISTGKWQISEKRRKKWSVRQTTRITTELGLGAHMLCPQIFGGGIELSGG
eukprot:1190018-Prorocentrum_minimum.AAC.2